MELRLLILRLRNRWRCRKLSDRFMCQRCLNRDNHRLHGDKSTGWKDWGDCCYRRQTISYGTTFEQRLERSLPRGSILGPKVKGSDMRGVFRRR